jgi:hypothetical protein
MVSRDELSKKVEAARERGRRRLEPLNNEGRKTDDKELERIRRETKQRQKAMLPILEASVEIESLFSDTLLVWRRAPGVLSAATATGQGVSVTPWLNEHGHVFYHVVLETSETADYALHDFAGCEFRRHTFHQTFESALDDFIEGLGAIVAVAEAIKKRSVVRGW